MVENRSSVAIIDLGSQHRPNEAAFRPIGKYSLVEWVIRRLSESSLLDAIALTGSQVHYEVLQKLSIQPAQWYPSESPTSLGRTVEVTMAMRAKWIVLVQDSSPFVDPVLVDRLIAAAWATPASDVISFASTAHSLSAQHGALSAQHGALAAQHGALSAQPRPIAAQPGVGLIAEICSRRALRRLASVVSLSSDQRSVGRLLLSMPEIFQPRYLPLPKALDRDGVRLVLETEDDWDRAQLLMDSHTEEGDHRELADLAVHCHSHRWWQ